VKIVKVVIFNVDKAIVYRKFSIIL